MLQPGGLLNSISNLESCLSIEAEINLKGLKIILQHIVYEGLAS